MKKALLFFAFVAMAALLPVSAAETAASVLEKTAAKLSGAKTLSASFAMTANGRTVAGKLYVSGSKFALTSDAMSTWFDGESQWTANHDTKEVNIIEPSAEEIAQSNPLSVVDNYKADFTYKLLSSASGTYSVQLTPKDKTSPWSKVVLNVSAKTWFPSSVIATMRDGTVVNTKITDVQAGINIPAQQFVFNKNAFPGYEIIDFR